MFKYGPDYLERIKETTTDPFWLDVINGLQKLHNSNCSKYRQVILTTALWYDYKFQLHLNCQWHHRGVMDIGDLHDVFHNILPLEFINETYNINMNFQEHHSLRPNLWEL